MHIKPAWAKLTSPTAMSIHKDRAKMQALDGTYQRVNRAKIHLANLKKRDRNLRRGIKSNIVVNSEPAKLFLPGGRQRFIAKGFLHLEAEKMPEIIAILVGEVIYNLRASLDYLIYELACFDSGQIVEGTQFPIETSVQGFNRRIGRLDDRRKGIFLRGVSDEHIAIIKDLQPCNGCQWTKILQSISNPDKHRELTLIHRGVRYNIPDGSTEAIIDGSPVNMNDGISINVAFKDGLPIIETLEQLHSEITKVLDLFKSEFK